MRQNQQLNCQVIMLPTDKAENCIVKSLDKLWYFKGIFTQDYLSSQNKKSYHLYLISDREIKSGDYTISDNKVYKVLEIEESTGALLCEGRMMLNPKYQKKVEATTDLNICYYIEYLSFGEAQDKYPTGIGKIPEAFIRIYYESMGTIKSVNIELEKYDGTTSISSDWNGKVKTRSDNTVIISQDKSYSKEEVIQLFIKYNDYLIEHLQPLNSVHWIKKIFNCE